MLEREFEAGTSYLPNKADWFEGRWSGLKRPAEPELGRRKNASSAKARDLLGWSPRPPDEAIVAAAESLVELGLVKS